VRIATLKESAARARNGPPMISSEVQRTLVKSPPELWAELSDPTSLARHLGELGEIKITRVEPERTVEWEAADTTGKVLLKASGWGTKVTLTAAREVAAPEAIAEPEPEPTDQPEPAIEAAVELKPEPVAVEEPESEVAAEPDPEAAEPEPIVEKPVKRPGFFARLFGRRPKEQAPPSERLAEPEATEEPELTAEPELTVEQEMAVEPDPIPEDVPSPPDEPPAALPDIAAELRAAEEAATAEVTAVLTAVLDRLGAAHHRPFSRA
jgi:hypothetical protein